MMPHDIQIGNTPLTMSSQEIADLVGSNHADVRRSIERLAERGVITLPPLAEVPNTKAGPKTVAVYNVGKRDSYVIVAQLSPEFTAKLVDRWQELEAEAAPLVPAAMSRMQILQIAMEAEEGRIKAESERDDAVRTKAQIGSKREASAMAAASKASREAERLRGELGHNARHATITAVEGATGKTFAKNAYVSLRRWCKQQGVAAKEVVDARYGTVKAWPAGAWLDAFGVDLKKLFGGRSA